MTEIQLIEKLQQDLKKANQLFEFTVEIKDEMGGALQMGKIIYITKLLDLLQSEQIKADILTMYQNEQN